MGNLKSIVFFIYIIFIISNQSFLIDAIECAVSLSTNAKSLVKTGNGCIFSNNQQPISQSLIFGSNDDDSATVQPTPPPIIQPDAKSNIQADSSAFGTVSPSSQAVQEKISSSPIPQTTKAPQKTDFLGKLLSNSYVVLQNTVESLTDTTVTSTAGVQLSCGTTEKPCIDTPKLEINGALTSITNTLINTKDFILNPGGIVSFSNKTEITSDTMSNNGGAIIVNASTTVDSNLNMTNNGLLNVSSDWTSNGLKANSASVNLFDGSSFKSNQDTTLENNSNLLNLGGLFNSLGLNINSNSKVYSEKGNIITGTLNNLGGVLSTNSGTLKTNNFLGLNSITDLLGSTVEFVNFNLGINSSFNIQNGKFDTTNDTGSFNITGGALNILNSTSNISGKLMNLENSSQVNISDSTVNLNTQFTSSGTSKIYGSQSRVQISGDQYTIKDNSILSLVDSILGLTTPKITIKDNSQINLHHNTQSVSDSSISVGDQAFVKVGKGSSLIHNGKSLTFNGKSTMELSDNSDASFNKPFTFTGQSKLITDSDSRIWLVGDSVGHLAGQSTLSLMQSNLTVDTMSILNMTEQSALNIYNGTLNILGYLLANSLSSIQCNQSMIQFGSGEKKLNGNFTILDGSSFSLLDKSFVTVDGNIVVKSSLLDIKNGQLNVNQMAQLSLNSGNINNQDRLFVLGKLSMQGNAIFNNDYNGLVKIYTDLESDDNSNIIQNNGEWHFFDNTNNYIDQFINNGKVNIVKSQVKTNQFEHNGGSISLTNAKITSKSVNVNGGQLFGEGATIDGNLQHSNGTIGSENTTSTLNITGNVDQSKDSKTILFLDVDDKQNQKSIIEVGNNINFNGSLELVLNQEKIDSLIALGNITLMKYSSFSGNFSSVKISVFNPTSNTKKEVTSDCISLNTHKNSLSLLVNSEDSCTPEETVFSNTAKRTILMASVVSVCIVLAITTAVLIWKRHKIATFLKLRRESRLLRQSLRLSRS